MTAMVAARSEARANLYAAALRSLVWLDSSVKGPVQVEQSAGFWKAQR